MKSADHLGWLGSKNMDASSSAIHEIVSLLRTIAPFRIVLFGSHAMETQDSESDIDLLVILDSENISQTYGERMQNRLMVRESLRPVNTRVPIDLIVHTRGKYEYLQRNGSSLLREIESSGKTLFEMVG